MNKHSGFEAPIMGYTLEGVEMVRFLGGGVVPVHMQGKSLESKKRIAQHVALYVEAKNYLESMLPEAISREELEKYYQGSRSNPLTIGEVFEGMISSAQNYQRMPNVIKFANKERREKVKEILFNYDLIKIVDNFDVDSLYQQFRREFNVTSTDSKMNSWRKWSHSIIDAAYFLKDFNDIKDFDRFVRCFDYNAQTRMALPLLLSTKISGMGFALMCDFLKELGYMGYPKPDVHMIKIYTELGLCDDNQINVFEEMVQMANDCCLYQDNITPFKVDKILWLICSGNFYEHGIKVEGRRDEFIEHMKNVLQSISW